MLCLQRPTRRTFSAYADSECIMCALSNVDLRALRAERPEVDRHLSPFVKHARLEAFEGDIDSVFGPRSGPDIRQAGGKPPPRL